MPGQVTFDPAAADGIARLTLSNPGKLNALTVAMWRELRAAVAAVDTHATRVLVVRGADANFAAGGDIEEFPDFRFDEALLRSFHEDDVAPALRALLDCDIPLMAPASAAAWRSRPAATSASAAWAAASASRSPSSASRSHRWRPRWWHACCRCD
jgi:enoyl-CoA hydratase/carnithine racemase